MKQKNTIVLWDAMPPRYQKDVEEVVKLAATKLDPKTFNAVKRVSETLINVLRTKKEFVLGSKSLKEIAQTQDISKSYDPGVELLAAYLSSDILSPEKLKGNLRDLLASYIGKIVAKSEDVAKTLPEGPLRDQATLGFPKDMKIDIKQNGQSATVTMEVNGQAGPPMTLTQIDGSWLPEPMVDEWDRQLQIIKQQLESITPQQAAEIHQGLMGAVGIFVQPVLLQLQNAKTQEEFDQAISSVVDMAKSQIGGAFPAPN